MALEDIASVTITRVSAAVTQAGFSTPLILAYHSRWTSDRVRSYTSLTEVGEAGFSADDTAYKIAAAIWAQPNPPRTVKIGRRTSAFTQTVRITPGAESSTVYTLELDGLTATYTSDGTATVAEIAAGLTAAVNALADVDAIMTATASSVAVSDDDRTYDGAELNGASGYRALSPSRRITLVLSNHADWDAGTAVITGLDASGEEVEENLTVPNGGNATLTTTQRFARVTSILMPVASGTGGSFTAGTAAVMAATDNTTHMTLVSPAGFLAGIEVVAGDLSIADLTTDPGIAAEITAVRAEDDDWYALLLDSNSEAEIMAAAAAIESANPRKILVVQSADVDCLDPDSIVDVAYRLSDTNYYRSALIWHNTIGLEFAAAAWVGNALSYDPGTVTWKFRELSGISAPSLASADRAALLAKNANSIETVAGRTITFDGKMAGGEWIDIVHGLDWDRQRHAERIFGVLVAAADRKIGFTDKGIARVHTEVRAQMAESEARGIYAAGWTTSVPLAAALSPAQRATRVLPSVTFSAQVQGAIHAVTVTGTVAD